MNRNSFPYLQSKGGVNNKPKIQINASPTPQTDIRIQQIQYPKKKLFSKKNFSKPKFIDHLNKIASTYFPKTQTTHENEKISKRSIISSERSISSKSKSSSESSKKNFEGNFYPTSKNDISMYSPSASRDIDIWDVNRPLVKLEFSIKSNTELEELQKNKNLEFYRKMEILELKKKIFTFSENILPSEMIDDTNRSSLVIKKCSLGGADLIFGNGLKNIKSMK